MSRTSDLLGKLLKARKFVRAPIYLYKLRLGFLFGHRMLLLEHIGRKSGARRYAVLEVVDHRRTDEYVIVSGFGEASQWYRNVVANPHVRVSVGLRRNVPALAAPMTREAAEETLDRYAERHPRTWRTLQQAMASALDTPDLRLPMVRLELALDG
ncbi:MAG: nitroreductase family deazaflavin-dependent oxidoreductase [Mycobacterium sp.]|jgi:deazaflavin-dependent oxidoreductase (nitroreductase family)|uniref:nitroreductase family deazaflavin-dependent oxidoreductase n=1 Tax=Mycobacterium sp. TaxID=1785 RepID=UPI001D43A50F|nr:nitroreductase family deazaflavin-dependent oxidoreductase [Mycobacterium sp.]